MPTNAPASKVASAMRLIISMHLRAICASSALPLFSFDTEVEER
jgi:hypothetical protein